MIAAVLRWLNRLWDRVEGPISDDDKAKIAAWQGERRERDANLAFTPEAEADVGNPDHRPTADHQPPRDEHEPPPAGGALPDSPPRSGRHAREDTAQRVALSPAWERVRELEALLVPSWFAGDWERAMAAVTA